MALDVESLLARQDTPLFSITAKHPELGPTIYKPGKVREIFADPRNPDYMVMTASDRISAFDVVLPTLIPHKGLVLTQMSAEWFNRTRDIVNNHFVSADPEDLPPEFRNSPDLHGRSMVVRKADPFKVECVVRG